ncbi:hypothetical protein NXX09_22530 [Bacteroides uniformis]|nr:hypothetical protein [Bacteroides uniformis]
MSYLPADFHIETNQGILSCSYRAGAGYIHFRKVMEIRRKRIPLALIPAWNDALRQWKKSLQRTDSNPAKHPLNK